MTDHPRFQTMRSRPEDRHRDYHGGQFVEFVFRVVDRWLHARPSGAVFAPAVNQQLTVRT